MNDSYTPITMTFYLNLRMQRYLKFCIKCTSSKLVKGSNKDSLVFGYSGKVFCLLKTINITMMGFLFVVSDKGK